MTGEIDRDKIRCNGDRRPHLFGPRVAMASNKWKGEWGSRLKGFFENNDEKLRLPTHDDWDCLEDMEREGLLEIMSVVNGFIVITARAWRSASTFANTKLAAGILPDSTTNLKWRSSWRS
jgi:hypothetical protein